MNPFRNYFSLSKKSAKAFIVFTILACGPGLADYDEFVSYFMPESTNASLHDQKYHFTSQQFYNENEGESSSDTSDIVHATNVKSWSDYCNAKLSDNDIAASVYGNSEKLITFLRNNGKQQAADYLLMAKKADMAYQVGDYFEESKKDSVVLKKIFEEIRNISPGLQDDFLKERYAFQCVKLAKMLNLNRETISLYEKQIAPLKKKSFISDWAQARKAGAELALGDTAKAYYDFAMVFDKCPTRRNEAELSVRIHNIGFQESAVNLCKDNHEKATLYAFAAIRNGQDGLDLLKKMVELDPGNPLIELVMAREINKNEFYFFPQSYYEGEITDTVNIPKKIKDPNSYFSKLRDYALECAENKSLPNTGFWFTAASYMEMVARDFDKSSEYLSKAKQIPTQNKSLKTQIDLQELLLAVYSGKEISAETEQRIIPYLEKFLKTYNFRISNTLVEACKVLSSEYRNHTVGSSKGGWLSSCTKTTSVSAGAIAEYKAKSYLMLMLTTYQVNTTGFQSQTDQFEIEDTTSSATINNVITYFSKSNPTDFDKRLIKLSGFSKDDLYTLLGRRALSEHSFALAEEAFGKVNSKKWKEEPWKTFFNEDPFYIAADNSETPNTYTPYTFAKKMADLEKRFRQNPNDKESAYLLGCGTFNITYSGNSWLLVKRGWSGAEVSSYMHRNYSTEYYMAEKSRQYFDEAIKSTDPELSAKACFGASKCEASAFFVYRNTKDPDPKEEYGLFEKRMSQEEKQKYRHYFGILKTRYQNTRFQQEILRECGLYHDFVAGK